MKYQGKNVVCTNESAANHGRPAELTVVRHGKHVVLSQAMPGGNSYAIKLGAELVGYSTKSALPEVLRSVGQLLANADTGPH